MRVSALLMAVALFVACDENPFKPSDVKEVTWKLESIDRAGSPTIQVPNPEQYTLKLGNDGRVGIRADCNTCSGPYTLDGTTLKIGQLACTLIACPIESLGSTYAGLLTGTSSVALSDSHLVLRTAAATLRFRN